MLLIRHRIKPNNKAVDRSENINILLGHDTEQNCRFTTDVEGMSEVTNNAARCQDPEDYPMISVRHESLKICNRTVAYIIQKF
jgi:hypothetical protein